MKLRYIHIRPPVDQDEWGNPLHCLNHGGFTVAYMLNGDTIEWNYAICHDKENFNKKLGREIASGRFYCPRINNFFTEITQEHFFDHLCELNHHSLQKNYPIVPFNATW
jgi:hypothetical protein